MGQTGWTIARILRSVYGAVSQLIKAKKVRLHGEKSVAMGNVLVADAESDGDRDASEGTHLVDQLSPRVPAFPSVKTSGPEPLSPLSSLSQLSSSSSSSPTSASRAADVLTHGQPVIGSLTFPSARSLARFPLSLITNIRSLIKAQIRLVVSLEAGKCLPRL